jgi:hypothetical protein
MKGETWQEKIKTFILTFKYMHQDKEHWQETDQHVNGSFV